MHVREWISLDHLDRMTDLTGMIQHAIYSVPRYRSGYTIDDNARALRLCTRLWCQRPDELMLSRVTRYMSLLEYARRPGGGFNNLLSYQHHWIDMDAGDCQGQAVRALAEVLTSDLPDNYLALAGEMLDGLMPTLAELQSLRAQAYVILAWGHLRNAGVDGLERLEGISWSAARRLVEWYDRSHRPDWHWFEARMTYANAVLPHALFVAAQRWPKEEFLDVAQGSFEFLDQTTTVDDLFWPIGNDGWYPQGEDRSVYDQQPVEAVTMADASLAAFDVLKEKQYLATFRRAHGWFLGQNSLRLQLVDLERGACFDGLSPTGVNRNQGAESTLAWLWTQVHECELSQMLQLDRAVTNN